MKRIIGLMGNSGSGKSLIAEYLKGKGAQIIDADQVSHDLCQPGQPGLTAVKEAFPPMYFNDDGTLSRKRLGRLVFADQAALQKLESILHPMIIERLREEIDKADGLVVIDCALLYKMGLHDLVDEVWLVMANFNQKLARIMDRDGLSAKEAADRLQSQMDETIMAGYADKIIHNEGVPEDVYRQVEEYLNDKS